jgi:hypothetical protein
MRPNPSLERTSTGLAREALKAIVAPPLPPPPPLPARSAQTLGLTGALT